MKAKYDLIGKNYNRTRRADPYLLSRFHFHLANSAGGQYLDIGCGTGNYTIALQKKGGQFTGIDPSDKMLEVARSRSEEVLWKKGKAEAIILPDAAVDGIVGSLTIHHWTDLERGFCELFRVLKPKGRIVLFTAGPSQMQGYWLNHYFPKMLEDSCQQMPLIPEVKTAMTRAGFEITASEKYFIRKDLEDLFLYSGKHRPGLYLQEEVRKGISSFAALANREEVAEGLRLLKADIESGAIAAVISSYENDKGDYLFLVGEKPSA